MLTLLLPGLANAQVMFSLFVGTRAEVAERMISLAKPKSGELVMDLGSGDGRLVISSAKAVAGVRGLGVDIDAKLVRESSGRAWVEGVSDRVKFLQQNVFDADLSKVDVIYMWLFPELMRLLRDKILNEARPGTRVVTQMFDQGAWQADAVDTEQASVRMWIVPAKLEGNWNWELTLPGTKKNSYAAVFDQRFQQADGVVRVGNVRRATREFKINGEDISFTLHIPLPGLSTGQEHEFSGKVKGNVIEGKVRIHKTMKGETDQLDYVDYPWRAARSAKSAYFNPTGLDQPR